MASYFCLKNIFQQCSFPWNDIINCHFDKVFISSPFFERYISFKYIILGSYFFSPSSLRLPLCFFLAFAVFNEKCAVILYFSADNVLCNSVFFCLLSRLPLTFVFTSLNMTLLCVCVSVWCWFLSFLCVLWAFWICGLSFLGNSQPLSL